MANYSVAVGGESHFGTLVKEVWAPKFRAALHESTFLSDFTNNDYEGEVKGQGDTVHVNTIPSMDVNDHVIGQDLVVQDPSSAVIDLILNKGVYYNFKESDVIRALTSIQFVNEWAQEGAFQIKKRIETNLLADVYSDADANNAGATAGAISGDIDLGTTGSPITLTSSNIIENILNLGLILDEQNVSDNDRCVLITARMAQLIKNSDLKDSSLTGDGKSTLRSGRLGELDRFTLYSSNLLDITVDSGDNVGNVVALQKSALTFAMALVIDNETVVAEKAFGKLHRGLEVYGYKVIQPKALAHGYFTV